MEKMRISKLEQKITRLKKKSKKKNESKINISKVKCFKCKNICHFANKYEDFNKNNGKNNQRNNNKRINILEEFYNKYFKNSSSESNNNERDKEIYAYDLYIVRRGMWRSSVDHSTIISIFSIFTIYSFKLFY
jgi:hypothetical protein